MNQRIKWLKATFLYLLIFVFTLTSIAATTLPSDEFVIVPSESVQSTHEEGFQVLNKLQSFPEVLQFLENPKSLQVNDMDAFATALLEHFRRQMNDHLTNKQNKPKEVSFTIPDFYGERWNFFCRYSTQINKQSYVLNRLSTYLSDGYCNRIDSHLLSISSAGRGSIGIPLSSWNCNGKQKKTLLVKPFLVKGKRYLLIKPENEPCINLQHLTEWITSPQDPYHRKERVIKELPSKLGLDKNGKFNQDKYDKYGISYLIQAYGHTKGKEKKETIRQQIETYLKKLGITAHDIAHRIGREHIVDIRALTSALKSETGSNNNTSNPIPQRFLSKVAKQNSNNFSLSSKSVNNNNLTQEKALAQYKKVLEELMVHFQQANENSPSNTKPYLSKNQESDNNNLIPNNQNELRTVNNKRFPLPKKTTSVIASTVTIGDNSNNNNPTEENKPITDNEQEGENNKTSSQTPNNPQKLTTDSAPSKNKKSDKNNASLSNEGVNNKNSTQEKASGKHKKATKNSPSNTKPAPSKNQESDKNNSSSSVGFTAAALCTVGYCFTISNSKKGTTVGQPTYTTTTSPASGVTMASSKLDPAIISPKSSTTGTRLTTTPHAPASHLPWTIVGLLLLLSCIMLWLFAKYNRAKNSP